MEYTFKKAGVKDVESFYPLFFKSIKTQFPEYSEGTRRHFLEKEYSLDSLKNRLGNGLDLYLAFESEEIVGYLLTMNLVGGICLANWIAVADEHQNKGVASKLLGIWEGDAKSRGIHKLHLWTEEKNIEFYKKRGFIYVGMIPDNFYGADDHLLYKTIQKSNEENWVK